MYQIIKEVACVDDFLRLREIAGLTPRSIEAAEKGLPSSLFGVHVLADCKTIGMGRVVGDGGLNFEVVDIAVDPRYQGNGIGRLIMQHIMAYLERDVPIGAYITLMADVPEFYKKFGFELSGPGTQGMHMIKSAASHVSKIQKT